MNYKCRKILLFVFLLFPALKYAQPNLNSLYHYTTKNGLVDNSAWQLAKDEKGFIWVITDKGISRFNGNTFKSYPCYINDKANLADNTIKTIYMYHGKIYALSNFKLYQYDSISDQFNSFVIPDVINTSDYDYLTGVENKLLLTGACIKAFNTKTHKFESLGQLDKEKISGFEKKTNNEFYIIHKNRDLLTYTSAGKLVNENAELNRTIKQENLILLSIIAIGENKLLCNFQGRLLYIYDLIKKQFVARGKENELNANKDYYNFYSTDKKIIRFHSARNGFEFYNTTTNNYETDTVLNALIGSKHSEVRHIYEDPEENCIWASTDNGIFKFYQSRFHLKAYPIKLKDFLSSPSAHDFLKLNDTILLVCKFSGLFEFNTKTKTLKSIPIKNSPVRLTGNFFCVAKDHQSRLWISDRQYLLRLNPQKKYLVEEAIQFPHVKSSIYRFKFDKKGNIYIATFQDGISCYNVESKAINKFDFPANRNAQYHLSDFLLYNDSLIFAVTQGGGLIKLNTINKTLEFISLSGKPKGFFETANYITKYGHEIWFSTQENGIGVYNCSTNSLKYIGLKEGLPNLWVENIVNFNSKTISGITPNEAFNIDALTKHVTAFEQPENIPETRYSNVVVDNNTLWYVTTNFFLKLEELTLGSETPKPILYKESFSAAGKLIDIRNTIDLEYTQNSIEIKYGLLDLSTNNAPNYFYRILPTDTVWKLSNTTLINLPNLAPNTYSVQVKAVNALGTTSINQLTYSFRISKPFWQTWWFYASCIVFVFVVFYSLYIIKLNRLSELQRIRDNISKDLHDDIGSSLSSIQVLSAYLKKHKNNERIDVVEIAEKINSISQNTVDNMSDIVWAINPKNDSIDSILLKTRNFLNQICEPKHIEYKIEIDEKITNLKMPLTNRRNFYLILKEAVNNSVKYSKCKNIDIRLSIVSGNLLLNVTDDGIGFSDGREGGNGLKNMEQRARDVKGVLTIHTAPGKGTKVLLNMPFT